MTTNEREARELANLMREDLKRLQALPSDERREWGFKNLQAIGVLDKNGDVTEPYRGTFVKHA